MSKHSLGPWDVDIESGIVLSAGRQVASVNPMDREANARLIAAAPDLLEALREVIEYLPLKPHVNSAYNRAQVAIAKAEGEAE